MELESLEIPLSLRDWIMINSGQIVDGIEKGYRRRAQETVIEYGEVDMSFRRSVRSLSEMPICDHAWSEVSVPPEGRLVPWSRGKVQIFQMDGEILVCENHTYARDSKNRVLCVTPGLFEAVFEDLGPGERLKRLKEKAPDLITLLPDKTGYLGIAILHGSDEEIFRKLGFVYSE